MDKLIDAPSTKKFFFAKISIFDKIYDFWRTLRFLAKLA